MRVFNSNKTEALCDALAEILARRSSSDPFHQETIIVQSRGMERWLTHQLAEKWGICANIGFLQPNGYILKLHHLLFPEQKGKKAYDNSFLTFRILALLPSLEDKPAFAPLFRYLAPKEGASMQENALKRYRLCSHIADLMNRYTVFRPDFTESWEKGTKTWMKGLPRELTENQQWQAELFSMLHQGEPRLHYAMMTKGILSSLSRNGGMLIQNHTPRISLFGLAAIPPLHLEFFSALSEHIEVNLFLMSPSKEYWGYIRSEREIARFMCREEVKRRNLKEEDLHFESGNRLLASWGKVGRERISLFEELGEQKSEIYDYYPEEKAEQNNITMLHAVQNDILLLQEGEKGKNNTDDKKPHCIGGDDESLLIHQCPDPMREAEALHDYLLARFDEDNSLEPRDILVMMPDIEEWAPIIKAVFTKEKHDKTSIPFRIADRPDHETEQLISALTHLLALPAKRFSISEVTDLFTHPLIYPAFHLKEEELPLLINTLRRAGARWGIDAEHKKELGLPGFKENSWEQAVQRILIGFAMNGEASQNQRLCTGTDVHPLPGIEGKEYFALGHFLDFFHKLRMWKEELKKPLNMAEWREKTEELIQDFFTPPEENTTTVALHQSIVQLQQVVHEMSEEAEEAQLKEAIPPAVFLEHLVTTLKKRGESHRFLTGSVTFSAMLPLRSIPFKVICLLGLDEISFPRSHRPPNFDLMAASPRPGDRSPGQEDRYLFLETVLSARNNLLLSYSGSRTSKPQGEEPLPSLLVQELEEYLQECFTIKGENSTPADITALYRRKHPLHPFSPRYFQEEEPQLYSYSETNRITAEAGIKQRETVPVFCTFPPSPPQDNTAALTGSPPVKETLQLQEVLNFFKNPAKIYLKEELCISFYEENIPKETESFSLDGLEKYLLRNEIIMHDEKEALSRRLNAEGRLPHGDIGRMVFRQEVQEVTRALIPFQKWMKKEKLSLNANLNFRGIRIKGTIASLYDGRFLSVSPGRCNSSRLLQLWIQHLFVTLVMKQEGKTPRPSYCSFPGEKKKQTLQGFKVPDNPEEHFGLFIALYLQRHQGPLRFYPETAKTWVERRNPSACTTAWEGNDYSKGGEQQKDEIALVERGQKPPYSEPSFQETAEKIFTPLFEHRQEGEEIS